MPYYKPCPLCGAALDPGEICTDCREDRQHKTSTKTAQKTQEKTAPDATNIESGKVKVIDQTTFTSMITNT